MHSQIRGLQRLSVDRPLWQTVGFPGIQDSPPMGLGWTFDGPVRFDVYRALRWVLRFDFYPEGGSVYHRIGGTSRRRPRRQQRLPVEDQLTRQRTPGYC
jgi:hypothetical protein